MVAVLCGDDPDAVPFCAQEPDVASALDLPDATQTPAAGVVVISSTKKMS